MVAGKEATPSDKRNTDRLHAYWARGQGSIRLAWGTPGDFDRCVAAVGKYMSDPKGYCAKMHHDVLGYWPATHAAMDHAATKAAKKAK